MNRARRSHCWVLLAGLASAADPDTGTHTDAVHDSDPGTDVCTDTALSRLLRLRTQRPSSTEYRVVARLGLAALHAPS